MDIFYALAEPRRRNILEIIAKAGEVSATDIYNKFRISAPAISQHLKVLKEAKLVKVEKRAQQRIYQINPEAILELEVWTKKLVDDWNERFDRLEELLEAEQKKSLNTKKQ
jgi:DNA-binding transcriptional ArsR family regulator